MQEIWINRGYRPDWNRIETPIDTVLLLQFGQSRLWIRRTHFGWALGEPPADVQQAADSARLADPGAFWVAEAEAPADTRWSNYFADEGEHALLAEISLPSKAVAARPEEPLLLPDGESAALTTPIPLELTLTTPGKGRVLTALSSLVLSKSLFGEPDTGEIVYSSPMEVAQREAGSSIPSFCARCDMRVNNISGGTLDISRVCIRVEYLGLFLGDQGFVSDSIIFSFRGQDQASSLAFKRWSETDSLRRIAPPRSTGYGNLIRKSFDFFRSLASY